MPTFPSREEIVLAFIESLRLTRPNLDTKAGTANRDLFIDPQSEQFEDLYQTALAVARSQSLDNALASDLDNFASNIGLTRLSSIRSTTKVLLTVSEFLGNADIPIPEGSTVSTKNGITFRIVGTFSLRSSDKNILAARASLFRQQLDSVGINDRFALEVPVEAVAAGSLGNVGAFTINTHSIPGISRVVNIDAASGGNDDEDDDDFRNRIKLAVSGNNVGTKDGFLGTVLSLDNVLDAFVAGPGNPLQLRDETIVFVDDDNQLQVQQEGIGGTVDIFILGQDLQLKTESFVYNDQSGRNDPTDTTNDIILGQINLDDLNLTLAERRTRALEASPPEIPTQPVESIVSITGSISGPNFIEEFVDSTTGETKGNFHLLKDTSTVSGSAFALDKIQFISDKIELDNEDRTKGGINEQDDLTFPDVLQVRSVTQLVNVINENSDVKSTDRTKVQLKLSPASDVQRVFNLTTGERYIIEAQPTEAAIPPEVTISGNTLPVSTDILQVDYIFTQTFDRDIDYAHAADIEFARTVTDSIDWAKSNLIDPEYSTVVVAGSTRTVTVTHPISTVISVVNATTNEELFAVGATPGTSNNNVITLPPTSAVPNGTDVKATYIAEVFTLLPITDIADIASQTADNLDVQPVDTQTDAFGTRYLRYAPTRLVLDIVGMTNRGSVAITGNSFVKSDEAAFTVSASQAGSLTLDIANLISTALGLSAGDSLEDIIVSKILKVENLTQTVDGNPYEYDLDNYELSNNSFDFDTALQNTLLGSTEFKLPSTTDNLSKVLTFNDQLRITFYFTKLDDIEQILFSEDGSHITSKAFFDVSNIAVSGFANSSGVFNGRIEVTASNQPPEISVYQTSYDYTAPKENERLTVSYNYNSLIGDASDVLESNRPVTADVLAREAQSIPTNITASIIADSSVNINVLTFVQDIRNSITQFLTSSELGRTIDRSDIINNTYNTVTGIDRMEISLFERQDSPGNSVSIAVEDNQAIAPGTITISIESR